ncbi:DUF2848 domain-containing protein [Phreatobacter stygius]|uniref:DUF2848 domain-containing protein n=1 Tax=Phreatobacter stygius TaxID=1940610 RepID=A0A4D7AUD3_9HYPH|nr:DUF2848 domain-containing protein [Phreatobacter stygius]QCI65254.1 DUF2848 domain-containing protein [Phreatobacter stygius]
MTSSNLPFVVKRQQRSSAEIFRIDHAVIAGWTGRDPAAREKHIAELEALGVKRPATTPVYYRVASSRLTIDDRIEVSGRASSGEVEFMLLRSGGVTYVGVGSDHTDRQVETYDVTVSKQMCEKPVAPELWLFDDVADHWDRLTLRSWATIDGTRALYQEGPVDTMLAPDAVIGGYLNGAPLPEGTAMFGGTLAARGGIRPADRFDFEIEDPVLGRRIRHGYEVIALPLA